MQLSGLSGPVSPRFSPPVSTSEQSRASAGAFVALLLLGFGVTFYYGGNYRTLAPLSASTVILFVMPHSPIAAPGTVIASYLTSFVWAAACVSFIPDPRLRIAAAVGLTIGTMIRLRCVHPPAGAAAAMLTAGSAAVTTEWFGLVGALAANVALLVTSAHVLNHWILRRDHPRPAHPERTELTEEDLRLSIRELNEFVDVREEDLVELYQRAVEHARARKKQQTRTAA